MPTPTGVLPQSSTTTPPEAVVPAPITVVSLPPPNANPTLSPFPPIVGSKRLDRDEVEAILDQFGVANTAGGARTLKKRRAEATEGSTAITFRAPITREIMRGLEDNLVYFLETFKKRIERYQGYTDACVAYYNNNLISHQNWGVKRDAAKTKDATNVDPLPAGIEVSKFSAASMRIRRPRICLIRDRFLDDETYIPRVSLPNHPSVNYIDTSDGEGSGGSDDDDDDDAFDSSESSLIDIASDCDFPESPFDDAHITDDADPASPTMVAVPPFGTGPPLSTLPKAEGDICEGSELIVGTPEDAIANHLIRSIKGIPEDFKALMRFVDIVQAEALELNQLLINIRDWVFLSLYAPDDVLFGGSEKQPSSPTNKTASFSSTMSKLKSKKGAAGSRVKSSASAGLRSEMQIEIAESITEVLESRSDTLDSLRQFKSLFLTNRRNILRAYAKFPHIPTYASAFFANEEDAWRQAMDSFKTLRRVCATSFSLVGRNLDSLRPSGGAKNESARRHALTSIYS